MITDPGTYRARAVEGMLGEAAKSTGNIPVVIEFVMLDEHVKGQRITAFLYSTDEKNTARMVESLRYCGFAGDSLESISFSPDNEVDLVIEMDTYQGKTKPKVKWINKAGASVSKLAPDAARAFAAKMRGAFLKHDAAAGAPGKGGGDFDEKKAF